MDMSMPPRGGSKHDEGSDRQAGLGGTRGPYISNRRACSHTPRPCTCHDLLSVAIFRPSRKHAQRHDASAHDTLHGQHAIATAMSQSFYTARPEQGQQQSEEPSRHDMHDDGKPQHDDGMTCTTTTCMMMNDGKPKMSKTWLDSGLCAKIEPPAAAGPAAAASAAASSAPPPPPPPAPPPSPPSPMPPPPPPSSII